MPLFSKDCSCLRKPEEEVHVLDYSHSNLDYLPSEVFHYERTLEELYINANGIRELPRELFYCHGLRKLSLCDNELKFIPPAIASLRQLEHLDISKNGIVDLPDNIKCCKHLSTVEASVNPLGKLPEGFTQLLNITELYLNDTFLDFLPGSFGRLSKLRILEVRENHLKTLPKSLSRLTALERLDIGNNDFNELPNAIGGMTNLLELWCDCNHIKTLSQEIGLLKQLMFLDASKNRIEWLPSEIDGCINLADLHLSTNMLEQLPENIGRLCNLTTLKVDDNRLTSLPFSIGGLVSLSEMNISANDLEELPPSIGFLRHLRTLYADENFLHDLPPELGSCNGLTVLSLRSNNLKYIPDEIGRIPRLRVLTLSDNKLRCLPYSLTRLKELQALWLSENQNKPTIRLQPDIDIDTGQRMLTCYLLPQVPRDDEEEMYSDGDSFHPSLWEEEREQRQRIHFDFEDIPEEAESKLQRHPTPYPKEMKFHAQHMRNLALKQSNLPNGEVKTPSPVSTPQKPNHPHNQHPEEVADGGTTASGTSNPATSVRSFSSGKGLDREVGEERAESGSQAASCRTSTHSSTSGTHPPGNQFQLSSSLQEHPHRLPPQRKIPPPPARPVMAGNFSKPPEAYNGPSSQPMSTADLSASVPPAGSLQSLPMNYRNSQNSFNVPPAQSNQPIHMPYRRLNVGRGYESDTASGYRSDSAYMYKPRLPVFGQKGYASDIETATRGRGNHWPQSGGYASDMELYLKKNPRSHQMALPSQSTIHEQKPSTNTYNNVPFSKKTMLRNDEMYEQYRNSYPIRPNPQIIAGRRSNRTQKVDDRIPQNSSMVQRRNSKSGPGESELNTSRSSSLNKSCGFADGHANGNNNDDDFYKAQLYQASVKLQKTPSDKRPNMQIAMLTHSPSVKRRECPVGSEHPRTPPPYQEAPAYGTTAIQPAQHATPTSVSHPNKDCFPPAQCNTQQSPREMSNNFIPHAWTNTPNKTQPVSHAPPGNCIPYHSDKEDSSNCRNPSTPSQPPTSRQYPYHSNPPVLLNSQNRGYGHQPSGNTSSPHASLTPSQLRTPQISHQSSPSKMQQHSSSAQYNHTIASQYNTNNSPRSPWLKESINRDGSTTDHAGRMHHQSRLQSGVPPVSDSTQISASQSNMSGQFGNKSAVDSSQVSQSLHELRLSCDNEYRMPKTAASPHHPSHAPHPSSLGSGGMPLNMPLRLMQYEKDVGMFKPSEPPSRVSSSTDSGYVHNQVDCMPGATSQRVDSQAPSPFRDSGVGNLYSRESTPGFSPSPHSTDISSEGLADHKVSPHQFRVTVSKNPGLGFSIAGGIGSPGNPFKVGDEGIFITKVQMPGPTSTMLQPGDKIIEVDGVDFKHIDHDEAVSVLRNTAQSVCLLIERS